MSCISDLKNPECALNRGLMQKIRIAVGNQRTRPETGKPAKGHLQWPRWKFQTRELE